MPTDPRTDHSQREPGDASEQTSMPDWPGLIPLGNHEAPAMPTDESVRRLSGRLWSWWKGAAQSDPFLGEDAVRDLRRDGVADTRPPSLPQTYRDQLQQPIVDWFNDASASRVRLVVLPPGGHDHWSDGWMADWAERLDLKILSPPAAGSAQMGSRPSSSGGVDASWPSDDNERPMMIEQLDRWFLRHQDHLEPIRELSWRIDQSSAKMLIVCGSWAYRWLRYFLSSASWLCHSTTIAAMDAAATAAWLIPDAAKRHADPNRPLMIRLTTTGQPVHDENHLPSGDYFATLAAQSRGIPWVAWQWWRRSLRLGPNQDHRDQQRFPDEATLWVTPIEPLPEPVSGDATSRLVLQALLLHDGLRPDQLAMVLPAHEISGAVSRLTSAKWIGWDDDRLRCRPLAYPQIRSLLTTAGFPIGAV